MSDPSPDPKPPTIVCSECLNELEFVAWISPTVAHFKPCATCLREAAEWRDVDGAW